MDFKTYLNKNAQELNKEVGRILEEQLKEAEKTDKKLVPLLKAFVKSCQGGKRIRGTLVKLGYELANGKSKEIIKIGAAYEIMHTAILVHDDIIDKSNTRRDKPSLYQVFGGNHYGISQAISLGDYGFFLAFKVISEADFIPERKILALELFSKVMSDTALGEILDLENTDPLIVISGACTNYVVMKLKTACYTVSGPLQLGAILGGADEKLAMVLGEFGETLGIAYQIRDDILDGDVKSIEEAKKQVRKYTNKAMKLLPDITKDSEMSKILEQMADYLIERKK